MIVIASVLLASASVSSSFEATLLERLEQGRLQRTEDLFRRRREHVRVVEEPVGTLRLDVDLDRNRRTDEHWWVLPPGRIERLRPGERWTFEARVDGEWKPAPLPIERLVKLLGQDGTFVSDLDGERFAPYASTVVPLLAAELRVVDSDSSGEERWHVVHCLALLEELTQHAESDEVKRPKDRVPWDLPDAQDTAFYALHMASARLWLAPTDVQERIIRRWHAWLKANPGPYAPAP